MPENRSETRQPPSARGESAVPLPRQSHPPHPPPPRAHRGCGSSPERPAGSRNAGAEPQPSAPRGRPPAARPASPRPPHPAESRAHLPPPRFASADGERLPPGARASPAGRAETPAPPRPTSSARSGAPQPRGKETPYRREESARLSPGHGYLRGTAAGRRRGGSGLLQRHRQPAPCPHTGTRRLRATRPPARCARRAPPPHRTHVHRTYTPGGNRKLPL